MRQATQSGNTFPIPWDQVESPITLTIDRMHFPHPLTPLTLSAHARASAWGQTRATEEYGLGMGQRVIYDINHYRYDGFLPATPTGSTAPDTRGPGQRLQDAIENALERWRREHLPALERLYARILAVDPVAAPPAHHAALLDELDVVHRELWLIHFRIAAPMLVGSYAFTEFYRDLFGGDDVDAYGLLVGTKSKSTETGIAMSDLANLARQLGIVDEIAALTVGDVITALESSPRSAPFLAQFRDFLDAYGLRQDMFDFASPTWRENPSIPLATIAAYAQSGHDARAEQDATAAKAETDSTAARARLAEYPAPVRAKFETMLRNGRHAALLQEEHNFYIDQMGLALLRLAYLRFADTFVRDGWLERRDDIFMLTTDDLRAAVATPADETMLRGLAEVVTRRRGEMEIAAGLEPPPMLGPPPATPEGEQPLEIRAMQQFFGGPPRHSGDPMVLLGYPGARGKVRGRARVVQSLEDAKALKDGEILVAPTTMPAWTPLFGVVAAVVTETGGSLSHCAIVAREYGIPAVVGARGATRLIVTGQEIEVNGTKGRVRLLARPSET